MDFDRAVDVLKGVPFTDPNRGRLLYDWVLENRPNRILELGTGNGASACYMAAALDELGRGSVMTMDRLDAKDRDPNIEQLAGRLGLVDYIEPVYAEVSFTWDLRRIIAEHDEPIFDFAFLDGGKTWELVGFLFFVTDRLLKPGGWLLFDDLKWTMDTSPTYGQLDWVRELPEDQRTTPQIGEVFELLVARHPGYTDVVKTRNGHWGWARKRPATLIHKLVRPWVTKG